VLGDAGGSGEVAKLSVEAKAVGWLRDGAVSGALTVVCAAVGSTVGSVAAVNCCVVDAVEASIAAEAVVEGDVSVRELDVVAVEDCAVGDRSGAGLGEDVEPDAGFAAGSRLVVGMLEVDVVVERGAVSVRGAVVLPLAGSERVAVATASVPVRTVELTGWSFRGADAGLGSLLCRGADAAGVGSGVLEAVESVVEVERGVLSVDGAELGLDALVCRGFAAGALALVSPAEREGALCWLDDGALCSLDDDALC
jgi:hypothetical protein